MSAIPKASGDTTDAIKVVIDGVEQHIREIRVLGRPVDFWDEGKWKCNQSISRNAATKSMRVL
ncbi:unnamed protein product, partial [Ceratitis capitata]